MKLSLVPREVRFYELFRQEATIVASALNELSQSLARGESRHARLRDLEHQCDDITHEVYKLTNLTFTPPMEPEDILRLAHSLDDVVDLAEEVSDKIDLYKARPIPEPAKEMGRCLASAGDQLAKALQQLEEPVGLAPTLLEVHRLENIGDRVTREALMHLFNGDGAAPVDVIKWKDLYDLLEETMDQCERVAEIVETLSLKNS